MDKRELLEKVKKYRANGYDWPDIARTMGKNRGYDADALANEGVPYEEQVVRAISEYTPPKTSEEINKQAYTEAWKKTHPLKKGLVQMGRELVDMGTGAAQMLINAEGPFSNPLLNPFALADTSQLPAKKSLDAQAKQLGEAEEQLSEKEGGTIGPIAAGVAATLPLSLATAPVQGMRVVGPMSEAGAKVIPKGATVVAEGGIPVVGKGALPAAAATGGGYTGTQSVQEGENRAVEAAIGAASGAAGYGAGVAISQGLAKALPMASQVLDKASGMVKAIGKEQPSGAELQAALIKSLRDEGVNFGKLPKAAQDELTTLLKQSISQGDREEIIRQARAQSLDEPVTLLKAQATKSYPEQVKVEQLEGYSPELQDVLGGQKEALGRNIKLLAEKTGGNVDATGTGVRKGVEARIEAGDEVVNQAYKEAEKQAGGIVIRPTDLAKALWDNRSDPKVRQVIDRLKDVGALKDKGKSFEAGKVSLKDLQKVRSAASKLSAGPDGHFVGETVKLIDDVIEQSGGPAYKEAVKLARANFAQKERPVISDIAKEKGGGLSAIQDSQIDDFLFRQPPEVLRDAKIALARGSSPVLREKFKGKPIPEGIQAAKDLKASFVNTFASKAMLKDDLGRGYVVDPAALVTAAKRIGGSKGLKGFEERAKAVLGPKQASELMNIIRVADDVALVGRAKMRGSSPHNVDIAREFSNKMTRFLKTFSEGAADIAQAGLARREGKKAAQYDAMKEVGKSATKQQKREARQRFEGRVNPIIQSYTRDTEEY